MADSDTTARQLLDAMGPPEMANLTPVLGKFGSLNVVVGSDPRAHAAPARGVQ